MSVTAAKGFTAAGIAAGIKENGNPDLALVVNNGPRPAAAGVFTSNRVKAAPVLWSEQVLKGGRVTAVVLNSGGANACTGHKGFQDTHATAEKVADTLGLNAAEVAVASTGLIGLRLPMDKLLKGVETAATSLSEHGGEKAAIAIKTTDSVHKTSVVTGDGWTVGGMAKGAGMLAPGLATMLVVLTVWVCKNGGVGEDRDLVDMRYREVHIVADLAAGEETATIWTNDLTADYVHENSAYSS
ncbi:bifunctional ornithine acetyltransferase/N-acetylglutamate synthase [Streptomyces sp. NPDC060223]|uniref:bifunctional ornithine acetyltransferase/N-acetylglutamate synthase n=1 Tax=Streptomyces sp. NPDC060223 TaxID=3347077 RepID=UPI00364EA3C1